MTNFWDDFPVIQGDLSKVHEIINESVISSNDIIREGLNSLVSRDGKLIRPGLVILSAYQTQKQLDKELPEKIYSIAAAIELLHMATLVHDDIIDESDTRRGDVTLHRVYGIKNSVLMGDYLFSRCFSIVSKHASMENAKNLSKAVEKICDSEISVGNNRIELGLRDYIKRIAGKTAALIMISMHVGSSESGGNDQELTRLHRVGYNLGMAFQIIDDILDISGNRDTTGKPVGSDLRQGIATMPLIYAVKYGDNTLQELLEKGIRSEKHVRKALKLVKKSQGINAARKRAKKYTDNALKQTAQLPESEAKPLLKKIIKKLLVRDY
jgi:heptaprenyl diphosphate synthase